MVGTRLGNDHVDDHRFAVLAQDTLEILRRYLGIADVAKADDIAVFLLDDQVVEFLGGGHQPHRADGQFLGVALDAARRQFHVFPVHRIAHIERSNPVSGHLYRIEPQTHRIAFFSPDIHRAHVRDGLQAFLDGQFRDFRQLHQRAVGAAHRDLHDRGRIGIGLGDGRRVAVARQVALGARNLVAHVVGRRFHIDRQFEFDRDTALSLARSTAERTDTRDTVDVLFQRFGDLVHDHFRIGSGVGRAHRDDRLVHARVFPHAQERVSDHSEQDDYEHHHGREHRTSDADFGYVGHQWFPPVFRFSIRTSIPVRNCITPVVSRVSPFSSPWTACTLSSVRSPRTISCGCAFPLRYR